MPNNKIPNSWTNECIGKLFEVVTGNTPPKNDFENYGFDFPLIKPTELQNSILLESPDNISIKGSLKARLVPKDTILVSCIGNLGKIGIAGRNLAFNQQINAILPNPFINCKFTFYFCQSELFKNELVNMSSATTISIVNKSKFVNLNFNLPPLKEQNRIVEKLEELLTQLDISVEELKKAKKQIKTYKQSVLKSAFSGKLTNENLEIDNETGLPIGWEWNKLGEYSFVTKLAGFEFTKYVKYKENGDIPVIRAQNVSKFKFVERNFIYVDREVMEKLPRSRIYGGEILMVFVGAGLGNIGIVPFNKAYFLGPNVAKIVPNDKIYNVFLTYFLSSNLGFGNINSKSKATAQGSISMSNIREVIIPIAPIDEQEQIVLEIEKRFSQAENLEKTIDIALKQAESLRQSILKKAFEGRLVPQDPNDEPASVLLERIKKEKNEETKTKKGKK